MNYDRFFLHRVLIAVFAAAAETKTRIPNWIFHLPADTTNVANELKSALDNDRRKTFHCQQGEEERLRESLNGFSFLLFVKEGAFECSFTEPFRQGCTRSTYFTAQRSISAL